MMIPIYFWLLQAAVPVETPASADAIAAPAPAVAEAAPIVVPRDTPVELMAPTEVSTAKATSGTVFKLRVNKAVTVDGRVIVPVGTPAFGEVTAATDSGGLGKSGRMSARLLHIQLGDARIPLEGEVQAKGTGAGSAGVALAVTLSPIALFHRGNNAKIKAGEIVTGFVSSDVALDLNGPSPRLTQEAPIPAATATTP